MVVKMTKWRPWPPLYYKKFEAIVTIHRLEGLILATECEEETNLVIRIKWKGEKSVGLSSLRRSSKRNFTKQLVGVGDSRVFEWNEEFRNVCTLSGYKENVIHPWEVKFTVIINGFNKGSKNRDSVASSASLNLADYVDAAEDKKIEVTVPLKNVPSNTSNNHSLCLSLCLMKLGSPEEHSHTSPRHEPLSSCSAQSLSIDSDEFNSSLHMSLRKVKNLTNYESSRRVKQASYRDEGSDSRSSKRSDEDAECSYPSDTDSLHDDAADGGDFEDTKETSCVTLTDDSLSYGTLASVNCVILGSIVNYEDEYYMCYSNYKADQMEHQNSKHRILPWKKRKLSIRSPKAKKGEPLLKKHYGEEGGDDIDYDRRQLSFSMLHKTEDTPDRLQLLVSEFEENGFAIGRWEHKEIESRDGQMKLRTKVFLASIDQRSESAAGESACAVLVTMIANWLKENPHEMPIKCELDSLIRDGSSEWRSLCDNKAYIEQFPNKHFDLDTVLQAKINRLSVVPGKSFVGFFIPEELENGDFQFLHGAMSFDSIWEEISHTALELHRSSTEPLVYIVSWNDHFFVLKVEQDAYYIIDTLGERLHEGCNQAFILKFDEDTIIERLPSEIKLSDDLKESAACTNDAPKEEDTVKGTSFSIVSSDDNGVSSSSRSKIEPKRKDENEGIDEMEETICRGKESCKEYIKSFLAAIPIRELQVEVKKGLTTSLPFHHRLQIEFHYSELKHENPLGITCV